MALLIGLLTAVLVLTCLFLGLLVLIQLPKKDAGVGAAFGGGMTDSIMGAGSGNVLTAATRYSAGLFLVLCLLLSVLKTNEANSGSKNFEKALKEQSSANPPTAPLAAPLVTNVAPAVPGATSPQPAAPAKPAEAPVFPGATPTTPGESLFPGATPTTPGESLFPGATPTAPGESLFPGATPTTPQ